MSTQTKAWISALRLRTLPLASASIILGSFLAAFDEAFSWAVAITAALTAIGLQVLSNLANDYGDGTRGTDNHERIGPMRAIQSGAISPSEMKLGMALAAGFSVVSGALTIYFGTQGLGPEVWIIFALLGLAGVAAAIFYTVGKNPYGYAGFGDLFVFLFFGLTGVCGSYYLHTHAWQWDILLPATAIGLLSVGVLNVNNMRDRESDAKAGKNTLVVKLGASRAKAYHTLLILIAIGCAAAYTLINFQGIWQWLFVLSLPLLLVHLRQVLRTTEPRLLDPQLKKLALSTLLFTLTFGIGLIL